MMKLKELGIILVSLLIIQVFLTINIRDISVVAQTATPNVFLGVDVAYDNLTATKQLADKIRPYSNLFIIGCTYGITRQNTTRLNELFDLCQYLFDKGFYFIIYEDIQPNAAIIENVRKYGNQFLGFYAYDELGGRQLDQTQGFVTVSEANDYSDASNQFVSSLSFWLGNQLYGFARNFASRNEFPLFTSDYALYWYDYKAGYDVVFAEFGWNYSRQLNVALNRGASTVQNKEWGAMITWTYTNPPYLESGPELYNDLVLAYNNGAKYICVFDTNKDYTQETLTQEQLDAIKQFWQFTQNNPRSGIQPSDRVAYLLPKDYAFGFRGPIDKIWGLWEADSISNELSIGVNILLSQYGSMLDIVYEEAFQQGNSNGYSNLIYWNDPNPVEPFWPDIPASQTPSPSPSPSANPTPNATVFPSSSSTPTPMPSLTPNPSESPTQQATSIPTPEPGGGFVLDVNYVYGATAAAILAIIMLFIWIKKKDTLKYSSRNSV